MVYLLVFGAGFLAGCVYVFRKETEGIADDVRQRVEERSRTVLRAQPYDDGHVAWVFSRMDGGPEHWVVLTEAESALGATHVARYHGRHEHGLNRDGGCYLQAGGGRVWLEVGQPIMEAEHARTATERGGGRDAICKR